MEPVAGIPPEALYTTPAEDALLGTTLFATVEVAKAVFGIEGRVRLVRGLTLCFALLLAFGNALFSTDQMPPVTGYLCWQTFLRALMTTFAAFGLNAVRDRGREMQARETQARSHDAAHDAREVADGAEEDAQPDPPATMTPHQAEGMVAGLSTWAGMSESDARTLVRHDPNEARRQLARAIRSMPAAPPIREVPTPHHEGE